MDRRDVDLQMCLSNRRCGIASGVALSPKYLDDEEVMASIASLERNKTKNWKN
jgi:hypothetical protein